MPVRSIFGHSAMPLAVPLLTLACAQLPAAPLPVRWDRAGDAARDRFGAAVAGVGDVDGDGRADVLVGAPGADPGGATSGTAVVLSGVDGSTIRTLSGLAAGDELGHAVAGPGDVDGDGVPDLLVGAPEEDPAGTRSGTVRLYSGATGVELGRWDGTSAHGRLGHAVAGGGDLDGDGVPDLLAGAPAHTLSLPWQGSVRAISGASGQNLVLLFGYATGDAFGWSIAGRTDVDGDGLPDVLVGAPQHLDYNSPGYVAACSGKTGALLGYLSGSSPGERFGWSVAVSTLDPTGSSDDIAVGAPGSDAGSYQAGRAAVYQGGGPGGTPLLLGSVLGDAPVDRLGTTVAGVGDLTGDGVPDWAVGAAQPSTVGHERPGYVRLLSGVDLSVIADWTGALDARLGAALAGSVDGDGDGLPDVLVGAPGDALLVSSASPGQVGSRSPLGARAYGAPSGPGPPLSLDFAPGVAPLAPSDGHVRVSGGAPFAPGAVVVSTAWVELPLASLTLLVDLAPGANAFVQAFALDGAGAVEFPVDLAAPPLAAPPAYLQAVQVVGLDLSASGGLEVLRGP